MSSDDGYDHLSAIDPQTWPGVATVPRVRAESLRAQRAEAAFAAAASRAGLRLDGDEPDLRVHNDTVFTRVAAAGWVGLLEGYLAGEWETGTSDGLVDVLRALVAANYHPRTPRIRPVEASAGGEQPAELISHYSGDGTSPFQGHFATGVPTTQRKMVKSFAPGAGRGSEPARHYVDVTEYGHPLEVDRADLADAQQRSGQMLIDAAQISTGTHLLIQPNCGATVLLEASRRGAAVDCVVSDGGTKQLLSDQLVLQGVDQSVCVITEAEIEHRFAYDAIASFEHLETLAPADQRVWLRESDAVLAPSGRIVVQSVLAEDSLSAAAKASLMTLRAYVWPGLSLMTAEQLSKLVDRNTGLRVIAESRAPEHLAESLKLQRATFETHLRDAAADGFDIVYRRLWRWQLALREALTRQGMLNLAQVTMVRRSRRGR
ncbi:class I SAM-dependent methyltransferase [Corynebacterium sp. Q4381]|uniref:class I SAM-dependent methyltransferase n=1 Tax=Corynebacterium sp. Marseille-Q4381 TaxID=3121597 RepID=UPI002FE5FABF